MSTMTRLSAGPSRAPEAGLTDLPHVLLVLDQIPKSLGGGERIVLMLAALLPEYGYRTSILTFSAHPESPALTAPPCPVYLLPLTRTYDLTAMRAAFELRSFLREQKVQLVQTFFESSDLWAGFVTKALSRAKLVWSRRDMGILRTRKHHISYRLMAKSPDAVFAVSEGVRRHGIEVDRIPADRVVTVYNGLKLSDWSETRAEAAGRQTGAVVTTVGNIRRVKGHDVLLEAADVVHERFPEVTFRVGGEVLEPAYYATLEARVRERRLGEVFQFVGGVTNLPEHLRGADIFVLPSRSEGFSNAIIEAMAASLPVVATDVGGNAEAVEDGITGFIVPPENVNALALAIERLIADPALAKRMGAAGRQRALERFTTEAMMQRIASVYDRLLRQ